MGIRGTCVLTCILAGLTYGCADLDVTNPNDPDGSRVVRTPEEVEALISDSYINWYSVYHQGFPSCALSVAADAHTASWGIWGMRDSGAEPRVAYDNDPAYGYSDVAEVPWEDSYAALAGVRDGLVAIQQGVAIRREGVDETRRAVAFGKYIQAQVLTNLALLFDQAFVLDETTDLAAMELVPAEEVWEVAQEKYGEVVALAETGSFTLPAAWVGFSREWTSQDLARFARAYRARHAMMMPRTAEGRRDLDWETILDDVADGLPFDYEMYYDGSAQSWGWHRSKIHCGTGIGWARTDNRTLGPADVGGSWEVWINSPPSEKAPFDILTPDSRITQPMQPTTDGQYISYLGYNPFPVDRGIYHLSNYMDHRFDFFSTGFIGDYPDFTGKEIDFIRAEAYYRSGRRDLARQIVNQYRANGDLPPFEGDQNPDRPDRCVPQLPDGSCGDLWEALKYEKRIELYHYGFAQEYFDDRGWGDLVEGTFLELPVPGEELLLLLQDIYTFGGDAGNGAPGGGVTPDFLADVRPETLRSKLKALRAWRGDRLEDLQPLRRQ